MLASSSPSAVRSSGCVPSYTATMSPSFGVSILLEGVILNEPCTLWPAFTISPSFTSSRPASMSPFTCPEGMYTMSSRSSTLSVSSRATVKSYSRTESFSPTKLRHSSSSVIL